MKIRIHTGFKAQLMAVIFYLFMLQDMLASVLPPFAYVDELFSLFGIAVIALGAMRTGRIKLQKNTSAAIISLGIFFLVGVTGNLIYGYQNPIAILIDILANFKFFLAILSGFILFRYIFTEKEYGVLVGHAKFMSVVLFLLLCLDLAFHIFASHGTRYGLREVQLFYNHPTYLAGAVVFLLVILMTFYEKKLLKYILMCLAVLFFTLRAKAIAGALAFMLIGFFIVYYRKRLRLWHIVIIAVSILVIAWDQFSYYYLERAGASARSALTTASLEIMVDYFPIGTGFGTFASAAAADYYTPVYQLYDIHRIWGLSKTTAFFSSDTFWPIIFGQTGILGTICYVTALLSLFRRLLQQRNISIFAYGAGIFIFAYLMICSTSEPAFHNAISIPLAMMLGYIFTLERKTTPTTRGSL